MKTLAVIPARGGSKRIPRKNIKPFLGAPIIKYSIDAARAAGCFDEVMVSTEDAEIAAAAKSFGASVPFLRSTANSSDMAGTAPVLEEVLGEYEKSGKNFEQICCIYPTAVFVTGPRLAEAKNLLESSGADAVVPVVRFSYPIQRAVKIERGELKMFWPENYNARSQDLEPAYHDAGQFYFLTTKALLSQHVLFAKRTVPMELKESEVQDIDNEEDWKLAEIKYQILTGKYHGK